MSRIKQGATDESVSARGGDLDGVNATTFRWKTMRAKAVIQSLPSYGGLLYVKLNACEASPTNWNYVLEPGVILTIDLPWLQTVAIHGTEAAVYKQDFTVEGWN